MNRRSVGTTLIMLLLLFAAGALAWRAVGTPGIVRAQQASATSATPTTQQQTTPQASSQQESAPPAAPQAPPQQSPTGTSLKAETREVRVDVVVTDKKGNYVEDLKTSDFRLYEDDKQQPINSFSFGADPKGPIESQRHYMVLFFDNSSMDLSDQPRARAAAGKFIDAYAGPDRVMAVVNFGGSLQFAQNFTMDATRLKQAVSGISTSALASNPTASNSGNIANSPGGGPINADSSMSGLQSGMPSLGNAEGNFAAYTLLLSVRQLAKSLASIPGRKSLILFTAGFELDPERFSELTATIDACNKANVAVYPLDVRGLTTLSQMLRNDAPETWASNQADASGWSAARPLSSSAYAAPVAAAISTSQPGLQLAAYHPAASPVLVAPQHVGGGGGAGGGGGHGGGGGTGGGGGHGGGGGTGGGGTGGGKGGTGGGTGGGKGGTGGGTGGGGRPVVSSPYSNAPYNSARQIVPQFPQNSTTNQQVMYALATGTGGFPILNTNDLMSGLEKIAREQSQYYLLGYTPAESPAGSCHTLKVKVERGGTNVRARSGFCNVLSKDPLAGKPIEKELASRATVSASAATSAGGVAGSAASGAAGTGSLEAPFFYTSANEARVHLAVEVPSASIDFSKVKGKYHADVNVLGIAYRADGTVASRFSDEVTLDMEKADWEKFTQSPMKYENQFSAAPGIYRLSVVVSGGGDKFAKFETPLNIDSYDGKTFSLSSVAMSNQFQQVSDMGGTLDADLLADRAPLVVRNMEVTPSGSNRFKKTDKIAIYAQIYAPQLADANPPTVKCTYVLLDAKTGKSLGALPGVDMTGFIQKGSNMIPVALKLPVDNIPPGDYVLKMQASESTGTLTQIRSVNFVLE